MRPHASPALIRSRKITGETPVCPERRALLTIWLLIGAAILLVCIAASRFSGRFGVPMLLVFIALGMLFGSDGLFKIPFDDYPAAEQICSFALIFILFYGGFGTNWKAARPVAAKAICLSTLGVVLTAGLTALFCHFVLRFGPLESFLIGSVISSTDAASVFSILRSKKLSLKGGTDSLLEVESGSNDPISYMLTVTALGLMQGDGLRSVVWLLFSQIVLGLLAGGLVAFLAVFVLRRVRFSTDGFDVLFVVAAAVLSYALASAVGGNGYLSAYLAGILLGNSITGLSQIVIFFLLGLLAFPSQMPAILLPSVAIALFLTFVSRPAVVFALLTPTRAPVRQQLLVSWAGLRGASSIVFAILATVSEATLKHDVYHIVFCVCLLSVAFQGTLLPFFARRLQMIDADSDKILKTFNDYQEEAEMRLIQTRIPEGHPWAGRTVGELGLVSDTLIVLIRRGAASLIPKGDTRIRTEDLLVLSGQEYTGGDDVVLEEIHIGKGHRYVGKYLREITFPHHSLVIIIRRADGKVEIPRGASLVEEGDVLVVSSYPDTLDSRLPEGDPT